MKNKRSNWFAHPSYFFFWFFAGVFAWSFSFDNPSESEVQQYSASSMANPRIVPFVSQDEEYLGESTVPSTAAEDEKFYEELKNLTAENEKVTLTDSYEITPEEIEDYEKLTDGTLDLDGSVQKSPEKKKHFSFENVSEDDLNYLITPEDPKQCGDARNYIEKGLAGNPRLTDWTSERATESKKLPRKCISFVMNSFPEITTKEAAISFKSRVSQTFAKCPRGSSGGPAMAGGQRAKNPVPCVSKNLVNATYNAFVDVMTCLKIEPKDLLPKIYNESGFYINALGGGMDGGIGQLTKPAIDQVNSIYPKYIEEITKAAAAKPDGACARIIKNKFFLVPAKSDSSNRCNLLWPAENPLRNLLYVGILSRYNMKYVSGVTFEAGEEVIVDGDKKTPFTGAASDQVAGKFKEMNIAGKLAQLGVKDPDLFAFQKMLTLVGYNSGIGSAFTVFNNYLEQRITANARNKTTKYNLKLSGEKSDFDFASAKSISAVDEARSYLMSSSISPKDSKVKKDEKIRKRKQLPAVWGSAYQKTFPEYIALRLNAYKGDSAGRFAIYGFPGYLSALAEKNKMIRDTFNQRGTPPNYCTSDKFLNFEK